jgi:hypothetical protein
MEEKLHLGVNCECNLHRILLYHNATFFLEYATN